MTHRVRPRRRAGHEAEGSGDDRTRCERRGAHRPRRHAALARRQDHARDRVEHDAPVLEQRRLRGCRRAADGRHHGNRLGGKPRRRAEHVAAADDRQVRRHLRQHVQARQVPHADRARQRAGHRRHLHLAPRVGAGSHRQDRQCLAVGLHVGGDAAGSRARGGNAVAADAPLRRDRGAGDGLDAGGDGARRAGTRTSRERPRTDRASSSSTTASTAHGAASASRSTASGSPSSTATGRRARISSAIRIRRPRARRRTRASSTS